MFAVPFGSLSANSDVTGAGVSEGGARAVAQGRFGVCCHCWASGTLGWVCGGPWHRHEVRDLRRSWFSHFLPFEYRHTIPPGRVSDALWITEETLASLMRQTHISSFSHSIINPDGQLSARPAGGHPCLSFGWDGSTGWLSEVALGHMVLRTPACRPSGKPLV